MVSALKQQVSALEEQVVDLKMECNHAARSVNLSRP
jgi:hypothetical protein